LNITYLYNRNNSKLYKVINNLKVQMWYTSKQTWGNCTTEVSELFIVKDEVKIYQDKFDFVSERDLERYMKNFE